MDTSEFTDEQIEALQALADGYNDQLVSRRDVMKLAGAGGVGALLGGGGAVAATEPASAGTAQSGGLGAIGDPLDLVIEDLKDGQGNTVASANAGALDGTDLQYELVHADDFRGAYATQLRATGASGVSTTIDPSNTTTPVTDALAGIVNGEITLPVGVISEDGPITITQGNRAINGHNPGASLIEITGQSADGLVFDAGASTLAQYRLDGFTLRGPGDGAATGVPLKFTGTNPTTSVTVPHLRLYNWSNTAVLFEGIMSDSFQMDFGLLEIRKVDAGNDTALMNMVGVGPSMSFQNIYFDATAATTASNSNGLRVNDDVNGTVTVQSINVGGTVGQVLWQEGSVVDIGVVNYEPTGQPTPADAVFRLDGDSRFSLGGVTLRNGVADTVFWLIGGAANKRMPKPDMNGTTINNSIVQIPDDLGGPVFYEGGSADVNNDTGVTLSHPVICEGDGVYKTSTGVGYDSGVDRKV